MEQTTKSDISAEKLITDGWVKSDEKPAVILFKKSIENRNPINDTPEDTDISLIVHCFYNKWIFVANTMAELKDFEKRILFYDCPY